MAQHDDQDQKRVQRELAKYEALDAADVDKVIAALLEHDGGQKFLWWLLQIGKYGINPFAPDPVTMAFQCGEINIGAQIMARLIDVNPMGFAQLQLKRKQEDDRRNVAASNIANGGDLFSPGADPGD